MANGRISLRSLLKVAIFLYSFSILDSRRIGLASFESTCQQSSNFTAYGPYYGLLWCKSSLKCCGHIARVRFTVKGYDRFRARRYPNSDSTFNLSRLVISGDICPNPGPSRKPCCQVCFRAVAINHRLLVCATCGSNYHMKCGDVKPEEFIRIQENTLNLTCDQCTFESIFPFASLSNASFSSSVGLDERNILNESSIDAECTESHLGDLLTSIDYSSKCLRIAHINICSL